MNNTKNRANVKEQPRSIVMPKSKPTGVIAKIIIAVSLLAVITLAALIYFNVGGLRDIFSLTQMAKETVENDIRSELDNQRILINEERKNLMLLKAQLDEKENTLNEKQLELEEIQQDIEQLRAQLQNEVADIDNLAKLYEKMEPANAASIIMVYQDKSVVVNVLKRMSNARAADILSEMDPNSAAQLIQMLSQ